MLYTKVRKEVKEQTESDLILTDWNRKIIIQIQKINDLPLVFMEINDFRFHKLSEAL